MPKSSRKKGNKPSATTPMSRDEHWAQLQESLYGLLSVEIDDPFTDLDHLCPRSAWLVIHLDLILPTETVRVAGVLVERALDALATMCAESECYRVDEMQYEGFWQRVLSSDVMKDPLSKADPVVFKFARFARCKGVRVLLSWRGKKFQTSTVKQVHTFLCTPRDKTRVFESAPSSRLSLSPRCVSVGLRLAECKLTAKDLAVIQELLVCGGDPSAGSADGSLLCDQEVLECLDLEGNRMGEVELTGLASLLEKSTRMVNAIGLKDTIPDDPMKTTSWTYVGAFKAVLVALFKSKEWSTRTDAGVGLSLAGNTLYDCVHMN